MLVAIFAAMVAALLLNMGTALLRAVGDTRGPAVIIASGCLVNAVLDVIFVAVLHMELWLRHRRWR